MMVSKGLFHRERAFDNGGEIWIMDGLDLSRSDSTDLLSIAEAFASTGSFVLIPHPIHYKSKLYQDVYGGLIGTKYERKCPDLIINGMFYEYESYVRPWNKRKLSNMLTSGLKQSDRIIIDNRDGTSTRQIMRAVRSRLNKNSHISEVWIYDGDGVVNLFP